MTNSMLRGPGGETPQKKLPRVVQLGYPTIGFMTNTNTLERSSKHKILYGTFYPNLQLKSREAEQSQTIPSLITQEPNLISNR